MLGIVGWFLVRTSQIYLNLRQRGSLDTATVINVAVSEILFTKIRNKGTYIYIYIYIYQEYIGAFIAGVSHCLLSLLLFTVHMTPSKRTIILNLLQTFCLEIDGEIPRKLRGLLYCPSSAIRSGQSVPLRKAKLCIRTDIQAID